MRQIFSILVLLVYTICLSLMQCSDSNLAGGGTIETTNGFAGVIFDKDGKPASNTIVKLFPDDYDPVSDGLPEINLIDTTDTNGSYSFGNVASGSYVVLARNIVASTSCLMANIKANKDSITTVPVAILKKPGFIKMEFSMVGGYVFIPGTDIFLSIENDGKVLLSDVPSAEIHSILHVSKDKAIRNILRNEIRVGEDDTVIIDYPLWNYSRSLVLNTTNDGAGVSGNVYDFPVLVRLNSSNFDFSQTLPDGKDLLFVKMSQKFLPFEIERWDRSLQCAEVWVKFDTIFGNDSNQSIMMYWGNPSIERVSIFSEVFDTTGGFQGVWHMDGARNDSVLDATENRFHGTSPETASPEIASGIIGYSRKFNGVDNYIVIPNSADSKLNFPQNGSYTVSAWVYLDTFDNTSGLIVSKGYEQYFMRLSYFPAGLPKWEFVEFSEEVNWQSNVHAAFTGQWTLLTGVRNGDRQILYCDGVPVDSTPTLWSQELSRNTSNDLSIGKYLGEVTFPVNEGYCFFKGLIDEVRINSTALSPDWIRLCYMNQRINDQLVEFR